jgi:ABC-type sugar transport system substrate-binding protein
MAFSLLMGCVKKTESGAVTDEGTGLIVYTQKTLDQYFHVALQANAENAVKSARYNFEAANCNFDSALQTDQMMNFLLKNPVAVIANPVDSDSLVDAIARAKDQGIPVVVVDNPSTSGNVDVTVTFDNEKCGYMAGTETAKRLIAKYGSAKGRVVNVYGAMSSES